MPLSDDEKKDIEARLRTDLEAEFERRIASENEAQEERFEEQERQAAIDRDAEAQQLRADVQAAFWAEKGYRRYVDSRGAEHWLTLAAYEKRMAKRRRKPRHEPMWQAVTSRRAALFLGVVVLAVVIGLALGHR